VQVISRLVSEIGPRTRLSRAPGLALGLHFDNGEASKIRMEVSVKRLSQVLASLLVILLAVVHAPTQAQALMFSVFQDLFPFGTNEPGMLFLTGITLLSLAYLGRPRSR
jgi:hypothetical protein